MRESKKIDMPGISYGDVELPGERVGLLPDSASVPSGFPVLILTLITALAAGSILVEEEHEPPDSARVDAWREPWDNDLWRNTHPMGITDIK